MDNQTNKLQFVKIFNQVVDEFFNEMIEMFPENKKIKTKYYMFQTLCKTNIRKSCVDFMTESVKYLEKISMKDGSLFLGDDKPYLLNELDFDVIWNSGLTDSSKNTIWRYVKTLITVGSKVVDMPKESQQYINFIINN
jgi:hypothetical protein